MKKKSKPNIQISTELYDSILHNSNWKFYEIPKDVWEQIPGIQRRKDVIAIMGSAVSYPPVKMHGVDNIYAGIDILVSEQNPRNNEPDGNAYHLVFQKTPNGVFVYGPFKDEMNIRHYFSFDDLSNYS